MSGFKDHSEVNLAKHGIAASSSNSTPVVLAIFRPHWTTTVGARPRWQMGVPPPSPGVWWNRRKRCLTEPVQCLMSWLLRRQGIAAGVVAAIDRVAGLLTGSLTGRLMLELKMRTGKEFLNAWTSNARQPERKVPNKAQCGHHGLWLTEAGCALTASGGET